MRKMMRTLGFAVFLFVGVTACATAYDEAEMQQMASAVTKVARQLDAYIFAYPESAELPSEKLVDVIKSRDAQLMAALDQYRVRFRAVGENSSVLICSKDGSRALLEDAGCSATSDLHEWDGAALPCEFSLDLEKVCAPQ